MRKIIILMSTVGLTLSSCKTLETRSEIKDTSGSQTTSASGSNASVPKFHSLQSFCYGPAGPSIAQAKKECDDQAKFLRELTTKNLKLESTCEILPRDSKSCSHHPDARFILKSTLQVLPPTAGSDGHSSTRSTGPTSFQLGRFCFTPTVSFTKTVEACEKQAQSIKAFSTKSAIFKTQCVYRQHEPLGCDANAFQVLKIDIEISPDLIP